MGPRTWRRTSAPLRAVHEPAALQLVRDVAPEDREAEARGPGWRRAGGGRVEDPLQHVPVRPAVALWGVGEPETRRRPFDAAIEHASARAEQTLEPPRIATSPIAAGTVGSRAHRAVRDAVTEEGDDPGCRGIVAARREESRQQRENTRPAAHPCALRAAPGYVYHGEGGGGGPRGDVRRGLAARGSDGENPAPPCPPSANEPTAPHPRRAPAPLRICRRMAQACSWWCRAGRISSSRCVTGKGHDLFVGR